MLHDSNHRDELARLHDRHKHLSMMVYDHMTANEVKEMEEKHAQMKEAEKELADFKKKHFNK